MRKKKENFIQFQRRIKKINHIFTSGKYFFRPTEIRSDGSIIFEYIKFEDIKNENNR